jgi:hypothetical protein
MNKLLIIMAIAVILFAGCSKSNSPAPKAPTIVGKWYFKSDTTNIYDNGTLTHVGVAQISAGAYVQFNSNGTATESPTNDTAIIKFTYSISSNNITLNYPAQTVNGNVLAATISAGVIKQLNDNNLFIYFDSTVINGGDTERTQESSHLTR